MKIIEIKELIENLYAIHGNDWRSIALAIQEQGYYKEMNTRNLADKIRKARTKGALRTNDGNSPAPVTDPAKSFQETITYHEDGSRTVTKLVKLKNAENLSAEEVLQIAGFKPLEWELRTCRFKHWNVFSKKKEGGHEISELFSASITAAPRKQGIDVEYINKLAEGWRSRERFPEEVLAQIRRNTDNDNILEINIADLHLGKLCWQGDTDNNYDTKIARAIFYGIVEDVIQRVTTPISKIYFVWSNDFFNSDTINKSTTAGTLQDTDIRWQKLFNIGCSMLIQAIIRLVEHFKVPLETFYLESNHDTMACYYAIKVLESRFHSEPNVIVDTGALPRKIVRYGNTMILFSHGHAETNTALASCAVIEGREHWSSIRYCEVHAAHLHSEKAIEEINGVLVRRIGAPTATDTWHKRKGYIGSVRKAQAFLINKQTGIRDIYMFPVDHYDVEE